MGKKKFLFVVEDKNEFYNEMMQEMAMNYTKKTDYDGFLKLHLTDDMNHLTSMLIQGRERSIKEIVTDKFISQENLILLLTQSIRYGFDIKDVSTGESIKDDLHNMFTLQRNHEEVGKKSRKTIGVLWDDESEKLVDWYKNYCDLHGLDYAGMKHLSTKHPIEILQFAIEATNQGIGKVLVAGPYLMFSKNKVNPLIAMLKENDIEVIDALLNSSLTDYACFRDMKQAVLIMLGDDETLRNSMDQYAFDNDYEVSFGCGLMGDTHPRILMDVIPQIADKQGASIIVIPDKENFNFKENEWDELIETLDKNGLQIESVKEGILEQKMKVTQLMN